MFCKLKYTNPNRSPENIYTDYIEKFAEAAK
jgi:hypothetical protein